MKAYWRMFVNENAFTEILFENMTNNHLAHKQATCTYTENKKQTCETGLRSCGLDEMQNTKIYNKNNSI